MMWANHVASLALGLVLAVMKIIALWAFHHFASLEVAENVCIAFWKNHPFLQPALGQWCTKS